jgi:hypothetical protein
MDFNLRTEHSLYNSQEFSDVSLRDQTNQCCKYGIFCLNGTGIHSGSEIKGDDLKGLTKTVYLKITQITEMKLSGNNASSYIKKQVLRSGSGIRCFLMGLGKNSGSGSRMNIPDHIPDSSETIFWDKNTKIF